MMLLECEVAGAGIAAEEKQVVKMKYYRVVWSYCFELMGAAGVVLRCSWYCLGFGDELRR